MAGMNKMVINHLEKLFVTKDAATIVKELEVKQGCFFLECFFIISHRIFHIV